MADLYISLNYEEWKLLEAQCKEFRETVHGQGSDYYHKSFRLKIGETSWEFHAPVVRARQPIEKPKLTAIPYHETDLSQELAEIAEGRDASGSKD